MNMVSKSIKNIALIENKSRILDVDENPIVTRNSDGSPKSYLKDDVWDYTGEIEGAIHRTSIVNFGHIDETIRLDIQKVVYAYTNHSPVSIGVIANRRMALCNIAECLGTTNWSMLDQDIEYRKFKNALRAKGLGIGGVELVITSLGFLYDAGYTTRLVNDKNRKFLNSMVCDTKKIQEQHIAIPEKMAARLFSVAMGIVDKYHPYRQDISHVYSEVFSCQKIMQAESRSSADIRLQIKKIKHSIPDFSLDVQTRDGIQIQLACLLVLQGFSGVRLGESLSFNRDSYTTIPFSDERNIPILKGRHSKPNKFGKVTKETWVTHPIAEKALELAFDMSEYARRFYRDKIKDYSIDVKKRHDRELDSAFIMLAVNLQRKGFTLKSNGLSERLTAFQKKHNIRATQIDVDEYELLNPTRKKKLSVGGFLPKLSAHDFRRTFAVFLVRNKLGNLMTLRHQYKHLNTIMTAWYANNSTQAAMMDFEKDSEMMKMVKEANEELSTDIIYNIFNETESLSGKEGERIIEKRKDYAGTVFMSREEIRTQVRNGSLSIVEHPTGYCTKPTCDRICATETSSITCQHEIVTREKAELRIPVRDRLIKKFNILNDERSYMANILSHVYEGIKAIELTLAKHGIGFTPFEAEIKSQTLLMIEDN